MLVELSRELKKRKKLEPTSVALPAASAASMADAEVMQVSKPKCRPVLPVRPTARSQHHTALPLRHLLLRFTPHLCDAVERENPASYFLTQPG